MRWIVGVVLALTTIAAARAATVGDYLRDGWDVAGFSNSTSAQIVLRRKDRILLCTINPAGRLDCADIARWTVNEAK